MKKAILILLLSSLMFLVFFQVSSVFATSSGYERYWDDDCEIELEYFPIVPYNPSYPTASEEFPIKFHFWENAWIHGPWWNPMKMFPRGFKMEVYYRDDTAEADYGAVGIYHLDEGTGSTVGDCSPYGNDGTRYGAAWTTGKVGNALDFNDASDYLRVNHDSSLNFGTNSFTVESWVYWRGYVGGDYDRIFEKTNYPNQWWVIDVSHNGAIEFESNIGMVSWGGGDLLEEDSWVHVAIVVDRDQNWFYLYKNGEIHYSQSKTWNGSPDSSNPLFFAPSGKFDGIIDEVRIHNRALSAEEIADASHASNYVTWKRWYPTSTEQHGLTITWSLSGGYGPLSVGGSVHTPNAFGFWTNYNKYYKSFGGKSYLHVADLESEFRSNALWGGQHVRGGGSIGIPNDAASGKQGHHVLIWVHVRLWWADQDLIWGNVWSVYRHYDFILGDDIPWDTDCWITVQQGETNFSVG